MMVFVVFRLPSRASSGVRTRKAVSGVKERAADKTFTLRAQAIKHAMKHATVDDDIILELRGRK